MSEHIVGPVDDFPEGTHWVVKVRNAEIGIFNIRGAFYALPNVCTHQFGPLCTGKVQGTTASNAATEWRIAWVRDGEIVTCPWHGLEFDILTGQSLAHPKVRLRCYAVVVDDGYVKLIV